MADKDGPEVLKANEENEMELNSFEVSFGSSQDGETEILNGDSLLEMIRK